MGDVRWPPSRSKKTLSGHVTALLAIAFLSCLVNGQSGVRPLQPSGRNIANYRIVPKPCKVKQFEGTCMFVWECMKTDGKAIGMCVDGFMFGSCCVHDADNNLIDVSRSKNETTESIPTTGNDVISKVQSVATPIVTTSFPSDPAGVSAKPKDKVDLVAETTASAMSQTASTTKSPTTATTTHESTNSASAVLSIVTTNNLKPILSTSTPTTVTLNPTTTQGSKTTTVNKTSPVSVPTMTVPVTMTTLVAAEVADGKPIVVGSSVTVTGSTASFVPKNSSSNSSSTTIIQGSNFQSSVATSRPVVSSENTGANVVVSSNIAIKPTAETISVPEFLPEGLIIQTATKPTRPTHSSARPTSSTPSTTAKPQTISASASGDTTTPTTNSDNVITLGLNRPFSGVSVETTIGSHEFHSHSVDAQFFVVSSTTAIKSSTTERPSTTQKIAQTTTRDTASLTDTVTAVPVDLTTEPVEFPEYLLEVTNAPNTANKRCGMQNPMPKMPTSRVVGGSSTVYGAWPWQASVRRTSFFGFSSTHRCGGTLLNENFVITAAHCVEDLLLTQIRVRLGEYDVSSLTEPFPVVERAVTKKIVHPKYNFFTYEHDIAILKLEEPVELSPTISPICLPSSDDLLVGMNATVTGWGRLSEGGTLPNVLQQVTLPIISNDKCKSMFLKSGRHEFIPEIFLCAGYEEGGRDACQGDSGGPLQIKSRDGRYFLAGIISWGIGCAEPNLPGVCTRISKFTNWILENVSS